MIGRSADCQLIWTTITVSIGTPASSVPRPAFISRTRTKMAPTINGQRIHRANHDHARRYRTHRQDMLKLEP